MVLCSGGGAGNESLELLVTLIVLVTRLPPPLLLLCLTALAGTLGLGLITGGLEPLSLPLVLSAALVLPMLEAMEEERRTGGGGLLEAF